MSGIRAFVVGLAKGVCQVFVAACAVFFGWVVWIIFTEETTLPKVVNLFCGLVTVGLCLGTAKLAVLCWKNLLWPDLSGIRTVKFFLFRREFGFFPREGDVGSVARLAQNEIDQWLQVLAIAKSAAEARQNMFNSEERPANASVRVARRMSQGHQREVDQAYDRFWRAWNLAKGFGYKVKENFSDYLSK